VGRRAAGPLAAVATAGLLTLGWLAALTSTGAAAAQGASALPEAAAQALQDGRAAMQQALQTYPKQYPDRPLWQEAFRAGERARSLAPDGLEPVAFLAEAYSRANWYGPAWEQWQAYLAGGGSLAGEQADLFAGVGEQLGYDAYRSGDLAEAAKTYQAVLDVVPGAMEAQRWAGRIALERGLPEEAVAHWQAVAEARPGDADARYFLELARDQARWGVEAVQAFRAGVERYDGGEMTAAATAFARATSANPSYAEAWAWLGRVAFEQERYADAQRAYGKAAALAPDNETYAYFLKESARRLAGDASGSSAAPGAPIGTVNGGSGDAPPAQTTGGAGD
jgi:tetratricopeptide (TPR) repeat protein